ncbi:hypothetical protein CPB83DRAFT_855894 [Crepidotus variabilis]|uniref:Rho GTPase activation protein n=1 Tax=Crepidotus variabilis TaxID=179855 RepID=A0A9P6EEE4_9AGAR|nr:hypothetical protein CPB83DRAFT_855894 [Crepidotus variabilis]
MVPPSMTLKQKLASLSLAQSAPSSSHPIYPHTRQGNSNDSYAYSPSSPTSKRKMFFTSATTWLRKHGIGDSGENQYSAGDEDSRIVQEVLGKMIFQAGVDYETRPMVVLNASALPDPQYASYDLLLERILSHLNLYVEADYTVVFFAAGSRHTPSWNWVWKAYRSLNRKYRKNLKQLYIVHSSFFTKMLFSLAGAIISPKFFRKISYIDTLSELAEYVPITQIDIPPAVYQENSRYERRITLPTPIRSSIFGVPLEDLMGFSGEKGGVPRVVKDAVQFLRDTGMNDEGLFRRSPSSALLRAAQEAYDRGNVVSLETFGDPYLAAVLIKKYLRDLPTPIFPEMMYSSIRRCPVSFGETDMDAELACIQYIREGLLPELVPCAYILLTYILHLLHEVSLRSDSNKMDAFNLAIVVCPNLVKSANPVRDVMMCSVPLPTATTGMSAATLAGTFGSKLNGTDEGRSTLGTVIAFCIKHYYEVFDDVADPSDAIAPWRALGQNQDDTGSGTYVLGEDDDLDDEIPTDVHGSSSTPQVSRYNTKRHKNTMSRESNTMSARSGRSLHNTNNDAGTTSSPSAWNQRVGAPNGFSTNGKARSTISIDAGNNGPLGSGTSRRGSIAIGRGTTRKGSGASVTAVGITAEGFFSAPGNAPPVPKLPSSPTGPSSRVSEEEERNLSVGERRRMFENAGA